MSNCTSYSHWVPCGHFQQQIQCTVLFLTLRPAASPSEWWMIPPSPSCPVPRPWTHPCYVSSLPPHASPSARPDGSDSRMAPTSPVGGGTPTGPAISWLDAALASCHLFSCPDHPCSHGQPQRDSQNHKSDHVPPLLKALSWLPVALCLKPTLLPVPGELTWSVLLPTSSSSLPPSDMYSLMHIYGVPTVC